VHFISNVHTTDTSTVLVFIMICFLNTVFISTTVQESWTLQSSATFRST